MDERQLDYIIPEQTATTFKELQTLFTKAKNGNLALNKKGKVYRTSDKHDMSANFYIAEHRGKWKVFNRDINIELLGNPNPECPHTPEDTQVLDKGIGELELLCGCGAHFMWIWAGSGFGGKYQDKTNG